jgi:hypothetical protein
LKLISVVLWGIPTLLTVIAFFLFAYYISKLNNEIEKNKFVSMTNRTNKVILGRVVILKLRINSQAGKELIFKSCQAHILTLILKAIIPIFKRKIQL